MEEWDILRTEEHDLSNPEVVQPLLQRIKAGAFDAVFMSPPCNTWSRAPHSNPWGPKPVRNKANPRGFPWAEGKFKELAELGNILVDVCFTICALQCQKFVVMLWEHPEDLGASIDIHGRMVFPASIWQLPEFFKLLKLGWSTVAFFQCKFGVDRLKPTRLLANFSDVQALGFPGPPVMDALEMYMGPLPPTCSHGGHPPLIKKRQSDPFHTTGTGVYPPAMDLALAQIILQQVLEIRSSRGDANSQEPRQGVTPQQSGLKRKAEESGQDSQEPRQGVTPQQSGLKRKAEESGQGVTPPEVNGRKPEKGVTTLEDKEEDGQGVTPLDKDGFGGQGVTPLDKDGIGGIPEDCWSTSGGDQEGRRGLMKAFYKGKSRSVHDGLGLCSMGRQSCRYRRYQPSRLAAKLKAVFWDSLDSWLEGKGKPFELKLISSLLCGKVEEQPFEQLLELIKKSWSQVLEKEGKSVTSRQGDRSSAVDLRLLLALAGEVGDPDYSYLEEMATTGVKLGAESEVPRIPEVYEEKAKWPLPQANEVQAQPLRGVVVPHGMGAPLSWRKTRGGQVTERLGYTIDIRKGLIGISEKKVSWLDTWITQVLKEGEVLGRDMRSALGRMGFLAGPLKHARPFLALVYRWTAKLGPGSWIRVPLGVRLVMEFFIAAESSQRHATGWRRSVSSGRQGGQGDGVDRWLGNLLWHQSKEGKVVCGGA
eukprot:Skav229261  [mRNA]  locus=scaffold952:21426:24141:- [translate_table: standard]